MDNLRQTQTQWYPPTSLRGRSRMILTDLWREMRRPRDASVEHIATRGELLVAWIRLCLLVVLLAIQALPDREPEVQSLGLIANLAALAVATLVLWLVAKRFRPWLAFFTAVLDVTLVTAGLLAFLSLGRPDVAANSEVLFELYFLAIGLCALRFDWRICAVAGGAAAVQFLALVVYARLTWEAAAPSSEFYGAFSWNVQIARLTLLLVGAVVMTLVVVRAQRLWRWSAIDLLTGLYSRSAFDRRLNEELLRARRQSRPLTVALVDIDDFRRFNHRNGQFWGDEALRLVSTVLRRSLRESDMVARYGGDQFALILPEITPGVAEYRLDELRAQVAATEIFPSRREGEAHVTISIGMVGFPFDGDDVSQLLMVADERLHQGKRGGGDQLIGSPSVLREEVTIPTTPELIEERH